MPQSDSLPTISGNPYHNNIDGLGTTVPQWMTLVKSVIATGENAARTGPINVITEHGATGDNSTDDLAAIQAAIDAAETAGGGVVYLPSRQTNGSLAIYAISGILRVPSNVSLIGDMERVSRIRLTAAGAHVALGASGKAPMVAAEDGNDLSLSTTLVLDYSGDTTFEDYLVAADGGTLVVVTESSPDTANYTTQTVSFDSIAFDTPSPNQATITLSSPHGGSGHLDQVAKPTVWVKQETQRHGVFGHLRITGATAGTPVANYCLRLIGGSNRTYTNLWLDGAVLDALYIDGVQNTSFDHIQIEGLGAAKDGRYGIHITGGAKQLWFNDVSVDSCKSYGIYFGNSYPNNSNPTGVKENTNIRFENLHMENNVTDLVRVEAGNNIFFDSGRMVGGNQKLFSSIKVLNVTEPNVARIGVTIGKGLIGTTSAVVIDAQDSGALAGTNGLYRVQSPYQSFGTSYSWTFDDEFDLETEWIEKVNTESGTSITVAMVEAGQTTETTSASPKTVTLPSESSVPIKPGSWFRYRNPGAGDLTIIAETAATPFVTLNGVTEGSITVSQYGMALVTYLGNDAWNAVGWHPTGGEAPVAIEDLPGASGFDHDDKYVVIKDGVAALATPKQVSGSLNDTLSTISVLSTASETRIITATSDIPANFLTAGDRLNYRATGFYVNNVGSAQTVTLRFKFDTVTLFSWVYSVSNGAWRLFSLELDAMILSTGATGTVNFDGRIITSNSGSPPNGSNVGQVFHKNAPGDSTIDTTQALTFDLTVQLQTNSADLRFDIARGQLRHSRGAI